MSRYIDADVRVGVPIKEAVIIEKTELTDECIDKIAEAVVQKLADRKTEPQTDGYMTAEQAEDYRKMLDKAEHKVYGNIEDEPQTDLLVTEYPQDGEVNLIGRDKTEAVVMAYDVYKELTEPQTDIGTSDTVYSDTAGYVPRADMTDCSWKKGE